MPEQKLYQGNHNIADIDKALDRIAGLDEELAALTLTSPDLDSMKQSLSDCEDVLDDVVSGLVIFSMVNSQDDSESYPCVCESGMTIGDWFDSDYNTNISIDTDSTFSVVGCSLTSVITKGVEYKYLITDEGDQ